MNLDKIWFILVNHNSHFTYRLHEFLNASAAYVVIPVIPRDEQKVLIAFRQH
jgi:hypothetical protein